MWSKASPNVIDKDKSFNAYWCPYNEDDVRWIAVADMADYMFTPKMTGCSFGVGIPAADGTVCVAHANVHNASKTLDTLMEAIGYAEKEGDMKRYNELKEERLRLRGELQEWQLKCAVARPTPSVSGSLSPINYDEHGKTLTLTIFGLRNSAGSWVFYYQVHEQFSPERCTNVETCRLLPVPEPGARCG